MLKRKDIIEILDGDVIFQEQRYVYEYDIRMPYLKGQDLVDLCNRFGLAMQYDSRSRWMYMDELMEHCLQTNQFNDLLKYLFSEQNFEGFPLNDGIEVFQDYYNTAIGFAIERINSILYFGKYELQFIDGNFYVVESGKTPVIDYPTVKLINMEYIHSLRERCENDFLCGNYDSVITKSRTMIEEVLIWILEQNEKTVQSKGDLNKLYNQVKTEFHMSQNKGYDGRVNSLLSGLERIVQSIGEMRNSNSDAHGVGTSRIAIKEREGRLVMNSAMTFCEYIISINESRKNKEMEGNDAKT